MDDEHAQSGATSRRPAEPSPQWQQLGIRLSLPKGSPRPPLLSVQLCDDSLAAGDNGEPLATSDIRLEGSSGTMEATLPGRIGYKDVRLRFAYSTAEVA